MSVPTKIACQIDVFCLQMPVLNRLDVPMVYALLCPQMLLVRLQVCCMLKFIWTLSICSGLSMKRCLLAMLSSLLKRV